MRCVASANRISPCLLSRYSLCLPLRFASSQPSLASRPTDVLTRRSVSPKGCARRVVALAKEAGIALTPAGAPYPHGKDPDDRTIRIAPTFPELAEVDQAATGVAVCVQLAVAQSTTATW